jgi:hypothetical protein
MRGDLLLVHAFPRHFHEVPDVHVAERMPRTGGEAVPAVHRAAGSPREDPFPLSMRVGVMSAPT